MTKSGALRGKPYLCGSTSSKPGVAGRLDSCTVSSLGATPLAPREEPLMLMPGSSWSPAATSSFTGTREFGAGDGEECWTIIEGVDATSGFLGCARRELRRDLERASGGGGDLRRGETGHWGVLSPEASAAGDFKARGALIESVVEVGGSCGMFSLERARCIAAAEGPEELVLGGPRLGLTSVLLFRERRPLRARGPGGAAAAVRCRLRAGEASRELMAELAGDGEPDALCERSLARDWRRIDGICVGCDAALPDAGACTTETWLLVEFSRVEAAVCVGVVDEDDAPAGSADSWTPVMLRKSPSLSGGTDVEVMFAVRLLLMAVTLRAALSCCAGCAGCPGECLELQSATR